MSNIQIDSSYNHAKKKRKAGLYNPASSLFKSYPWFLIDTHHGTVNVPLWLLQN